MKEATTKENAIIKNQEMPEGYFFRDKYRRVMSLLLVMTVSCVGLSLSLGYLTLAPQKIDYYASTTTGIVVPIFPLSEPVITTDHLLQWARIVTRAAYNLNFVNYQQQLDEASQYFAPSAWQQFLDALDKSGLLSVVRDKKLMTQAVVSGPPVVLRSGTYEGRFFWIVQMPILVTYTSASATSQVHFVVTMNITRVPALDTPEGIQVVNFKVGYRQ